MVGELGPELLYFNGGERVMNASQTKQATGGVHIDMGGIHVTVTGGTELQSNIEPLANELSNVIAEKLTRIFGNKTVTA